jgi:hypothetical protein
MKVSTISAITTAPKGVAVSVIVALVRHALLTLRDPGFQAVVKRGVWQFVVSVSEEARAAWLRT